MRSIPKPNQTTTMHHSITPINRPEPHPTEPAAKCYHAKVSGYWHLIGFCPHKNCGGPILHEKSNDQVLEEYSRRECCHCSGSYWVTLCPNASPPSAAQQRAMRAKGW